MTLDVTHAGTSGRRASRTHTGIAGAALSAVATMIANVQLMRAAHGHKSRGSPPANAHLRRDLGLALETERPSHWDYR